MYIGFIIFLVNTVVCVEISSDETKYIDLLPEKEKDEFLEKIARRIFHSAQSNNYEDKSDEAPDENDFIRKVLEDESLNLRKSDDLEVLENVDASNNNYGSSLKENDSIGNKIDLTIREGKRNKRNISIEHGNENSKIIHFKPDSSKDDAYNSSNEKDIQIINFKRNIAEDNEIKTTTQNYTQWTQIVDFNAEVETNNSEDIPQHVEKTATNSIISQEEVNTKNTDTEPIMEEIYRSTQKNYELLKTNHALVKSSFEVEADEVNDLTTTVFSNAITEAAYSNENVTNVKPTIAHFNDVIRKIDRYRSHKVENKTDDDIQHIEKNYSNTKINHQFTKVVTEIENIETKTDAVGFDLASVDDATASLSTDNIESITFGFDVTTAKSKDLSINKFNDSNSKDEKNATTNKNHEAHVNKKAVEGLVYLKTTEKIYETENNNNAKQGLNIDNLANAMLKVLRQSINPEVDSNKRSLENTRPVNQNKKREVYNVFEVPTDTALGKKDESNINNENPFYIPIYNYSPNNVYYDPHNRLGPNADSNEGQKNIVSFDDIDEDIIAHFNPKRSDSVEKSESALKKYISKETHANIKNIIKDLKTYLYERENQRKFKFGGFKSKSNNAVRVKINLPMVVKYPKFTDIILNENDYLDMDYSYGRSLRSFCHENRCRMADNDNNKKSLGNNVILNDEEHLKDRMRSIRMMMYKNKIFGYIPSVNSSEIVYKDVRPAKHLRSEGGEIRKEKQTTTKNIAMDYFFGRMNENEESKERSNEVIYKTSLHKMPNDFEFHINHNGKKNILNKKVDTLEYNNYFYNAIQPATPNPGYIDIPIARATQKKVNKTSEKADLERIRKILYTTDTKDLLPTLEKLMQLKMTKPLLSPPPLRSKHDKDIEPYVIALKDMVASNNKGLMQYGWLETTVDIQAAIMKMVDMIDVLKKKQRLNNLDLQLLKYIIYLYKTSSKMAGNPLRKFRLLPRNKKKKKGYLKESGLYSRNWLFRKLVATLDEDVITYHDLQEFSQFLNNLGEYLYDLHLAIQNIAIITKYRSQHWFGNLKQLYLDPNRKQLLEVLLHMTTSRLLDLIENSAKHGLEDDFLTYSMNNEKEIERTQTEMVFALKIITELKNNSLK